MMNISTRTLPEGYAQTVEIDLKKNKRLAITLNVAALVIAVPGFFLLASFAASARPELMNSSGTVSVGVLAILMGLMVILFTLHEAVHGFLFWVFTRSRPVFAMRLFYAYAGAPAWYIPVRQYAIVTVGPLVIIGAVGLLLMLTVPESWVLFIVFVVAMNTGGSAGDLLVLTRLFKLSATSLANDTGDVVSFYENP